MRPKTFADVRDKIRIYRYLPLIYGLHLQPVRSYACYQHLVEVIRRTGRNPPDKKIFRSATRKSDPHSVDERLHFNLQQHPTNLRAPFGNSLPVHRKAKTNAIMRDKEVLRTRFHE